MRPGRTRLGPTHLTAVGGIVLLFGVTLFLAQVPAGTGRDTADARRGSSHYTTPSGGKALYELLRATGVDALRHERRPQIIDPKVGALFVLAAPEREIEKDFPGLDAWIHGGGTVVWTPREDADAAFLAHLGVKPAPTDGDGTSEVAATLENGGRSFALSIQGGVRFPRVDGASVIAEDDRGGIVVSIPRGAGRIVLVSDRRLFSNGGLSKAENGLFAVHLARWAAGNGAVAFDEYPHGFHAGESAAAVVWASPLRGALVVGLAAAFAGVFATGRRLGPPVDLHEARRRKPSEFMHAFADLCRRMNAGPVAAGLVADEFQLFLRRQAGAEDAEAAERAARRAGLPEGTVAAALESARRVEEGDEPALVEACRKIEAARGAILKSSLGRRVASIR